LPRDTEENNEKSQGRIKDIERIKMWLIRNVDRFYFTFAHRYKCLKH
jgi:hypothetical protein